MNEPEEELRQDAVEQRDLKSHNNGGEEKIPISSNRKDEGQHDFRLRPVSEKTWLLLLEREAKKGVEVLSPSQGTN